MRKSYIVKLSLIILIAGLGWYGYSHRNNFSADSYVTAQMESCRKNKDRNCYKDMAAEMLTHYSLSQILTVFDKNENSPAFFESCHQVAHYLGQDEYKRLKSLSAVFLESSRACLGGAYHGAVEGYFMDKKIDLGLESDDQIMKEVSTICGTPSSYKRPQDFTECNHGLGHAAMYIANYDLPKAMNYCDALGTDNERALCYTGALMANGDSFGKPDHATKYIKADDPLYPCPILKPWQQSQCYTYGVLTRFQSDLPKSISICLSIPEEFRDECFKTFGRDRTLISSDPENLKTQCYEVEQDAYRRDCISGTAYNLIIRFGIDSKIPINYCGIVDSQYLDTCYTNIIRASHKITLDKDILKKFCGKINDENYNKQCLSSV